MPIPGDIGAKNLGLSAESRKELCDSLEVIISCAANTNFDNKLLDHFKINYYGPLALLQLAKECGPNF